MLFFISERAKNLFKEDAMIVPDAIVKNFISLLVFDF